MRYQPSLDGLRGLAVLIVMAFHARLDFAHGGFLGVDVFFVLSGYLITRLLADDFARSGSLSIGAFYLRRLQRLYPALLLMLVAYTIFAPLLFTSTRNHAQEAMVAALYFSDYGLAFWKTPWYVQHTWSLSVEEHFYLAWPLLLCLLLRLPRRCLVPTILALFVSASLWRWHVVLNTDAWHQPYYRFDTRLSGLLLGAAAALHPIRAPRLLGLMGATLLLFAMHNAYVRTDGALMQWMLLAEVSALMLILGAHQLSLLSSPPLVWVGKLSYGLYLWHYPIMLWLRNQEIRGWASFVFGGLAALACAAISYYTVERIFRQRRVRTSAAPGAFPPTAGTGKG